MSTIYADIDKTLQECWTELGISQRRIAERGLPVFTEAANLEVAEVAADGREHRLVPAAARAWSAMKAAASAQSVEMHIVSAHRSVARQIEIIRRKLNAGQSVEEILAVSAPPGCSEHHTGRAVDIGTVDSAPLEPEFESTPAWEWLCSHAGQFGFVLSYPQGNRWGYSYEPWHWCFREARQSD